MTARYEDAIEGFELGVSDGLEWTGRFDVVLELHLLDELLFPIPYPPRAQECQGGLGERVDVGLFALGRSEL